MARKPERVISHWYNYVEGFSTSAMDFYAAVEAAVNARELPGVTLSRVEFKESGILSAKREYLRIQREKVAFDLGAAPYGGSAYFFSWWLAELPGNPPRLAALDSRRGGRLLHPPPAGARNLRPLLRRHRHGRSRGPCVGVR